MAQHEAVVAGHLCLDVLPELSHPPRFEPGSVTDIGPATLATGGAVSNTGVALHRLGVPVRLAGKVGDDLFGQAIRRIIGSYGAGLAGGIVVAPGEASSYTIVLSRRDADRMFLHHPGCNATFGAADVPDAALAGARLLHFGYPPSMASMYRDGGRELVALLRRARTHGLTTSLDMTMPDPRSPAGRADWRALLAAVLPLADVFMPSVEELLLMADPALFRRLSSGGRLLEEVGPELLGRLAAEMLAHGPALVGLKAGHRGLYLRSAAAARIERMGAAAPASPQAWAERELWAPCFAAAVAGTTGSGDATIAGFLMALLRGFGPEAALRAANAVGGCSVEAADALGGVRGWPETAARMAAGWPRLPLDPGAAGWRWDAEQQVWFGPGDRWRAPVTRSAC